MPLCAAFGCNSGAPLYKGEKYRLHSFPKLTSVKNDWLERINRVGFVPTHTSRLCSKHFSPEAYLPEEENVDEYGRKRKKPQLKERAVPTLYLRPPKQQQVSLGYQSKTTRKLIRRRLES